MITAESNLGLEYCSLYAAVVALMSAARLAVIELEHVEGAKEESNALPDLKQAMAKVQMVL